MKHYKAHWSTSLIVLSSSATILCLVIGFSALKSGGHKSLWMGLPPLVLVVGCALFTIRSYTLASDVLLIHRLFWRNRLTLVALQSARFEPRAMQWSIRTFGNGGFFSFTGFYRNKLLGAYRAFVTDPRRTVGSTLYRAHSRSLT